MNLYAIWFKRVVWFGILANVTFAILAILTPDTLLKVLKLGAVASPVWLFNYSVLLIILSCFYIPAAHQPYRYIANAWLLVAGRLIPATTFFVGVATTFMAKGFFILGIGDASIGCVEALLLVLALKAHSDNPQQTGEAA